MKIISFIERDQREVIEKLQCTKRTSPFGPLTRRAWEANPPALRAVGGGIGSRASFGPGAREEIKGGGGGRNRGACSGFGKTLRAPSGTRSVCVNHWTLDLERRFLVQTPLDA